MSSNPYENEPGFEDAKSSEDQKNIANYVAKVSLMNLHLWVHRHEVANDPFDPP